MISDEDGGHLVRLARDAVAMYLKDSITITFDSLKGCSEHTGVFVTLNYYSKNKKGQLRGCMGLPFSDKNLYQSVIEASISASTQDPRFHPVTINELENIVFEVSILTPLVEIKVMNPEDYVNHIKIGRDGLVFRWKYKTGLLLPQVPVELNWSMEEYLYNICLKAGVSRDRLFGPESRLYRFEAIIYKESEPYGKVVKLNI